MVETIKRVGNGTVPISVMVNDQKLALPAIHARGDYFGDKGEFFFLDDEQNPIALKYRIGRDVLDVVKVSYACSAAPIPSPPVEPSTLERALADTGRADVYSIYFSFNSDEIREESEPTLKQIAELLRRRSDWKLGIGGHTDNVASDTYNLDLSRRRAAAVKHALVARHGIVEQPAHHYRPRRSQPEGHERHARRACAQPPRRANPSAMNGMSTCASEFIAGI